MDRRIIAVRGMVLFSFLVTLPTVHREDGKSLPSNSRSTEDDIIIGRPQALAEAFSPDSEGDSSIILKVNGDAHQ